MRKINSKIIKAFNTLAKFANRSLFDDKSFLKLLGAYDKKYKEDPDYRYNIEGIVANAGIDTHSVILLNEAIRRTKKKIDKEKIPMIFKRFYDIGNMIHSKASIIYPYPATISQLVDSREYNEVIAYYSKVESIYDNHMQFAMAKTNAANILNQFGRNYEAILLYNEALSFMPNFGMALANKAKAFVYYYNLNHEKTSTNIYYEAMKLFEKALRDNNIEKVGGKKAVDYFTTQYENMKTVLSDFVPASEYILLEKDPYLEFCQRKNFFLNHHFGYAFDDFSFKDNMYPPFIQESKDMSLRGGMSRIVYFCTRLYNQILEEYSTSRLLYYKTVINEFSRKENITEYIYTFDYAKNSIKNGILKSIYVKLFSILDKIAVIVYVYFIKLDPKDFPTNFGFEFLLKEDFGILVKNSKNYQLLALNSLAKDFQTGFSYHYLRERRNNIMHWFLDVYEIPPEDNDQYHLSITDLELDIEKLFLITKAALFYLEAAVKINAEEVYPNSVLGELTATHQRDIFD